jgi:Predicted metal-dependent hydrolase of the TIM-barrel fold
VFKAIDSHAHWFSAKVMDEKEFIMASAESWGEGEINADVLSMNKVRPFYLALRNELRALLGENFLEERNRLIKDDPVVYVRMLLEDAGVTAMVVDEGFGRKEMELPVNYKLLFRIERVINDLFNLGFDRAVEVFTETLRQKLREGYSGFKTIIAYRTGLKILCDEGSARKDYSLEDEDWFGRKAKGFRDYLVCLTLEVAKEAKVPVQIHTGAGDRDIKLELSRPSYLTDLVRRYEGKVVLVHSGYPYHRESAWMSYIFPSVYLDVSEFVPFAPLASYNAVREIYEVAPLNKVMFGSDVFNIPETAWLASKLARRALKKVSGEMVELGILNEEERKEMEESFFYRNAERVYGF